MLKVLRPGGVAVHTTEFNASSNMLTITQGDSVIYRKRDILEIARWMLHEGHKIAELDFSLGNQEGDRFIDTPPYFRPPAKYHIRLWLPGIGQFSSRFFDRTLGRVMRYTQRHLGVKNAFASTSIGLIFQKKV